MEYELTPEAIELGRGVTLPAAFELGQKSVSLVGATGLEAEVTSEPIDRRATA
jgi:hypothetical protein